MITLKQIACVLMLFACMAAFCEAEDLPIGQQVAREAEVEEGVTLKYWLYLPEDYSAEKKFPLVLFLHGMGERGDDMEKVLKHGPPKLIHAGKQFPFITVSPQLPLPSARWYPEQLTKLLDEVEQEYSVDADRIYVTGLSMGGYGTWSLGAATPERFAALLPICGGGDPDNAEKLKPIPIWVFHGTDDRAVPIVRSEEMVNAVKAVNGNVLFTIYPDVEHDSWTETYNNPAVYEWLLNQSRQKLALSPEEQKVDSSDTPSDAPIPEK